MKRRLLTRGTDARTTCSVPATALFLLLAVGLVLLFALGLRRFMREQATLPDAYTAEPTPASAQQTAAPSEEPSSAVAAVITPAPETSDEPNVTPAPDTPAASPAMTPTPMPTVSASDFSRERMDLAILGFDEQNRADVLCIVAVRGASCTVLSLPKNTLCTAGNATLADAASASGALLRISEVYPVKLRHYIRLDMTGLPACVDAFGGVHIDGAAYGGEETAAYLSAGGSDELLRITRQQTLMRALIAQLRSISLLRLLSAKYIMQRYTISSLSANQYIELYNTFRHIDADQIRFLTLPVDSCTHNGTRCYIADRALAEALVQDLYPQN